MSESHPYATEPRPAPTTAIYEHGPTRVSVSAPNDSPGWSLVGGLVTGAAAYYASGKKPAAALVGFGLGVGAVEVSRHWEHQRQLESAQRRREELAQAWAQLSLRAAAVQDG